MNLKMLQWLLKHRDLLMSIVAVAKKFDRNGTYMSQWEVVDEIARIVIPVFEREAADVKSMADDPWDDDVVGAFAVGAEVSALGVDWQTLVQVVLPILIAILKALSPDD